MITGPTILLTLVLIGVIAAVPRRHVLTPLVLAACFVPAHQHLFALGLHFYVIRLLILAGMLRIVIRGEQRVIRWNRFDKLVLTWALVGAAIYVLRRADFQAVIFKSGQLLEILGIYWIARQAIRSWADLKRVYGTFAVCAIVLSPFVAYEWATGSNPFRVFGGYDPTAREGDFRCIASFPHAIIAGSFWAPLIPLIIALALTQGAKMLYWCAAAAGVFIVFATNSSTPIGGVAAVLLFVALYRYRHYGRLMAMTFFGTLVALHIVMKGPVWSLLARVSIVPGSTGWHRYNLIEQTVRHFSEWAILGQISTSHWGWGLHDLTNQYCLEAVRGGLLTLILFVALLFVAIRTTGAYALTRIGRERQWLVWALCCSFIGHSIMFLGVSYFGQILMLLYLTFALAGTMYEYRARDAALARARVRASKAARRREAVTVS